MRTEVKFSEDIYFKKQFKQGGKCDNKRWTIMLHKGTLAQMCVYLLSERKLFDIKVIKKKRIECKNRVLTLVFFEGRIFEHLLI